VCGGTGESKRKLGPAGVVVDEENSDDSNGRTKRMRSGRRFDRADNVEGAGSVELPFASRGLLRGRAPPNWCTRMPGPPPRLNTN